ncbi:MAG: flagellar motor switch protein FliM [Bacteroidetes bacterium]|nr:flagellar motor switch protein FliM [Bacteroidota bacterium]
MPEILSQQEIDSLLSGVPLQEIEKAVAEERHHKEVITFDFRLPHRLSKNQLRTLQAIHESFAESLGSFLVSKLQTTVSITVTSVDQLFYSEYVLSVPNPSCLYIFRIVESDAYALMELSPQLVLAIISRLLGGQVEPDTKQRPITRIEQRITKGIIQRALTDLRDAWKAIADLNFTLERYETEGDFAQIAPLSEIVLLVTLEVTLSEQKFLMNVCFPTFALDSVFAKMNTQNVGSLTVGKKDPEWTKSLLRKVSTTNVEVVGLLGTTTMTLRQLLNLRVGDVIRTNIPAGSETQVVIGNKPRLWGKAGISNGRLAIKITRTSNDQQ